MSGAALHPGYVTDAEGHLKPVVRALEETSWERACIH
jgi:hypothetical protein